MVFEYFSKNGELLPIAEAVVPLSNIEYAYGFGAYETIRAVRGKPRDVEDHLARLMESCRIIGIEHSFTIDGIKADIAALVEKNAIDVCNLKLLLVGGPTLDKATLSILCLNPIFPDKKLYRDGCDVITYEYERMFPHAKSLNMLGSYLAYKKAKEAGAYDALLVNRAGFITEGTRTNFFCIQGKTIYSPPEDEILLGVTRDRVLACAKENGFTVEAMDIRPEDVASYDSAFVTSTSSKIMPIRAIGHVPLKDISTELRTLMDLYEQMSR
ncbi:aminotransferase class IV [Candidatus Kaiserbacteria bacterium]|nr:aminotransferase class IV [Candidatus Kaiserbacteria bacterium]